MVAAASDTLQRGDELDDVRVRTFQRALRSPLMVPTPLIVADRTLGFALGPPAAPPGTVLYRESPLGPLKAPPPSSTAPFAKPHPGIYGSARPASMEALATTPTDLPLHGDFVNTPLTV